MIDYQGLRDTNERLKPLRRFLEDLQHATDQIASAQQDMDYYTRDIQGLKTQKAQLERDCEASKARLQALQDELVAEKARLDADLAEERAAYQAQLSLLMQAFTENQDLLDEEKRQAHAQHVQFLASLAASRSQAETEYQAIVDKVSSLRAHLKEVL